MATKRMFSSIGILDTDELYSLCIVPSDNGIDVKICKTTLEPRSTSENKAQSPVCIEFFDYTDDLFKEAWKQSYDRTICEAIDPFIRWKYKGTKIYELLYHYKSGQNDKTISSDILMRVIRNLIVCDPKTIMYIQHLTECESQELSKNIFFEFLKQTLSYNKNGSNSRLKLGISKNKERVLKEFPMSCILKYSNDVFDDDIDFLLDVVRAKDNNRNILIYILNAKASNPKLKYFDIARNAIVTNLENKDSISFTRAMENINRLSEGYNLLKSHGYNQAFKLVPNLVLLNISTPNAATKAEFTVKDGYVFPIVCKDELRYANAVSDALHSEYIEQAIERKCQFYLIKRKKKYYLAEILDGEVINVFRNGKCVILDIERKESL